MPYTEELYHYGVLGMKWGVRRYQNSDGSLTEAGRKRLGRKAEERKNDKHIDANRDRLVKDKIFRSLAKDVVDSYRVFEHEKDNVQKMCDDYLQYLEQHPDEFRREAERYVGHWSEYGDGTKEFAKEVDDFMNPPNDYYDDRKSLFYNQYAHDNDVVEKAIEKRDTAFEKWCEVSDGFSKALAKELAPYAIRKLSDEELAKWGWKDIDEWMDSNTKLLMYDILGASRRYSHEAIEEEKNHKS